MSIKHSEATRTTPGEARPGFVLVIDDGPESRAVVMDALARGGLHSIGAASAGDALARVSADPSSVDAIILVLITPVTDWIAFLRTLKTSPTTVHIPVLMVTGATTRDLDIVHGVELGATETIAQGCSPVVLAAKVRAVRDRAEVERRLRNELRSVSLQAMSDPLTGLFNRRHFAARIHEATARAKRHDQPFSVVLLDLDHFKAVNDIHGHTDGDRVLVHFANTIHVVLRADDVAFRYGGDEFVLLLSACDAARAIDVAERLRMCLGSSPITHSDGTQCIVAFSAGVAAALVEDRYSGEGLLRRADVALYRAKTSGSDRVRA